MPGNSQSSSGTYTVEGAGIDIGGMSDQFQYCYQSITGDVDIRVRVAALQNTSAGSKFGLMIRESMNASARNVFVLLSAEQQLALQWRTKSGRATGKMTTSPASAAPVWIRLVRQGNTFRAYRSSTGATWTQFGTVNFRMSSKAYIGLAVTSHAPFLPTTGTFSSLSMGSAPALPSPWTASDIGNPSTPGGASESGGTFTVSGAGTDIFNSSDQFQFVSQPVTGDTQIVAKVASFVAYDTLAKAGVMIRADLTASAANAAMFATASSTWVSQTRLAAGASTFQAAGPASAPPGWVKVVREGDTLSTFQSPDGTSWTLVDSDTIPMPSTVYVGLAVTGRSTTPGTATFSNVTVSAPPASNNPPTVSITAPVSGANYTAPANMTIAATAADSDGSVAKVDFYRGSTLIASDTTSPYSVSWNNVAAGTYSLTAVATDNAGDTTTSMPVSVTVNAANKPPTVSISSPGSGASFTAPAGISISATAGDTDGSVVRVDFYSGGQLVGSDTVAPFTAVWSNVPIGAYSLTAIATDNDGATTTSGAVSVSVTAAPLPPVVSTVVFVPGADYATNATSVTVELRRASDLTTATPVASKDLGKPAVVNGEISADISSIVDPLAAGSYYAVIVTTGTGGSTPSSPSPTFTK